jgi:iron complex outermembrane receptor protein/outer membrane receptor for ferrienterochelin and colicins
MKHLLLLAVSFFIGAAIFSQNTFSIIVKDKESGNTVPDVSLKVRGSNAGRSTDKNGLAKFNSLSPGKYILDLTSVGYAPDSLEVNIPDTILHEVFLSPDKKELEEVVIISSTRNDTKIENSPLKVEVLGKEEMDEESSIKPGNIASILGDVSGIQIQQSSAVSGNANIRIQGLDGRYTQILRDGMPLYEGFSGGFGILSIPPLDLKQIELIKGSASTLYGGGAIGGLINMISKRPTNKQEAIVTINQTTLKETNLNTYLSKRSKYIGYTLFAGYTHIGASDVNKDQLSDVADLDAILIHPKLFIYPDTKTNMQLGYNGAFEKRKGGDMLVLQSKPDAIHKYFEENKTTRHTGEFIIERSMANRIRGSIKSSISSFNRDILSNTHFFRAQQVNYFSELSLFIPRDKMDWVLGINTTGDKFIKKPSDNIPLNNFSNNTVGVFAQYGLHFFEHTTLETGLRYDHTDHYGNFILPRLAFFHRFNETWATRLGFGMGYKIPNALAQQNIEYDLDKIQPIRQDVNAEISYGYNAEVNFKKKFGEDNSLFINQAFFLTQIQKPVIVAEDMNGNVNFINAAKSIVTKGTDTYVSVTLKDIELYVGYTFTLAKRNYLPANSYIPLTPKNRFAFTAVYNIENLWRYGLEGSFTGPQYRDNDSRTPGYFFLAGMIERKFGKHFSLVLNGENLLDYRQSKYEPLFIGTITNPQFKPLWAPIDGIVVNLALRIKL